MALCYKRSTFFITEFSHNFSLTRNLSVVRRARVTLDIYKDCRKFYSWTENYTMVTVIVWARVMARVGVRLIILVGQCQNLVLL